MKTEIQKKEIVEYGNVINLSEVRIGDAKYKVKVSNLGGNLCLDFNDGDYSISVIHSDSEDKIQFARIGHRPDHDHNDFERLERVVDEEKAGEPKGTIKWRDRFPSSEEGWEMFYVDFGAVKSYERIRLDKGKTNRED